MQMIDLERYPIDQPDTAAYRALVAQCQTALSADGLFNLDGFVPQETLEAMLAEVTPTLNTAAFTHARRHNIYFDPDLPGLPVDHPVRLEFETANRTICADQIEGSLLTQLYDRPELPRFLADVMGQKALFPMDDRIACCNVMGYSNGQALNWHFDRAEFTTTLLLQAPDSGGAFQYRQDLRSADDPNYDGVARMLAGEDDALRNLVLSAGTLNVFRGRNTAHRVTPVAGTTDRIIAVFSYFDTPGVVMSDKDKRGFYGRA